MKRGTAISATAFAAICLAYPAIAGQTLPNAEARSCGTLVRVSDRAIVDEAKEIRSRPMRLTRKPHAYRALEAKAEFVETDSVLGDACYIPLHDAGVKMIFNSLTHTGS